METTPYDERPAVRRRRSAWPWIIGGLLVLVLLGLLLVPMLGWDSRVVAPTLPRIEVGWPPGREANVTVDDIADRPRAYAGKRVTVSGAVGEILSQRAFSMGGQGFFEDGLLVLTHRPLRTAGSRAGQAPLTAGDVVQVTGTVREFDLAAMERELGVDLDDARLAGWAGRPALLATAIEPAAGLPDESRASAAGATPAPGRQPSAGSATAIPLPGRPPPGRGADVTVDMIAKNPRPIIDRTVTVTGEVGEILGRRAFTIEDEDFIEDERVLVVSGRALPGTGGQTGQMPLIEEDRVQVTGTVRWFDLPAFERELGVDLDESLFAGWAGRPAIVATEIDLTPSEAKRRPGVAGGASQASPAPATPTRPAGR